MQAISLTLKQYSFLCPACGAKFLLSPPLIQQLHPDPVVRESLPERDVIERYLCIGCGRRAIRVDWQNDPPEVVFEKIFGEVSPTVLDEDA